MYLRLALINYLLGSSVLYRCEGNKKQTNKTSRAVKVNFSSLTPFPAGTTPCLSLSLNKSTVLRKHIRIKQYYKFLKGTYGTSSVHTPLLKVLFVSFPFTTDWQSAGIPKNRKARNNSTTRVIVMATMNK